MCALSRLRREAIRLRTTSGLHIVRRRRAESDRWYIYARRGGPLVHTQDGDKPEVTPALLDRARQALTRPPADDLASIIQAYRASPQFDSKAPKTQEDYRQRLDQIEARFGRVPIRLIPKLRGHVIAWRDEMADTPRAADRCVGMLQTVLTWAEDREMIERNPLARIGKLHRVNRADLIWEDRHWQAVADAPPYVHRVLVLASLTGLRIGDLLQLRWENLKPGHLALTTGKSRHRTEAIIPLHPELARFLIGPPWRGEILRNNTGAPWTLEAWKSAWGRAKPNGFDRKGHDLRGTFATRMMIAGFTDTEIAMVMGWRAERIAAIRMRYVDRTRIALALAERFAV